MGDIVLHAQYGIGMVLSVEDNHSLTVQFKYGKETCPMDSNSLITREDYLEYKSSKEK